MEEKRIINKNELKKIIEDYTLMSSETYMLEFAKSSLEFSESKKSFIFDYTLKVGNGFLTNKVILFDCEIKNILNYYYKDLGYKVNGYKILNDENSDIELSIMKVKNDQKVKVRL